MNKKLYRVNLRGCNSSLGIQYYTPYVVAETATKALEEVQNYLNKHGVGNPADREMDCVELLAEESEFPACKVQLFICSH